MANLQILADELNNDPLGIGYAGMNDQEATDSLNTVDRTFVIPTISGDDVFEIVVDDEFEALVDTDQTRIRDLYNLVVVETQASHARQLFFDIFAGAGGLNSRTNWTEFVTGQESRGVQIGFGFVREANVTNARAL